MGASGLPDECGVKNVEVKRRVGVVHMHIRDVRGELLVIFARRLVKDEEQQVETGQEGGGQVDVLHRRDFRVVATVEGIGSCEDGRARVERCDNASFRDGYCLLFLPYG